ncbi:beta/alpha barrel domain-containing protein [Chromobacterium vaccinii]|uniref:hypothetical protein n=1 Tax=Chromobacterium vaccinii TaxID=1108595 RepID=UPI000E181F67|nr:hypothetical protein [Chromobacterium vaccinii]SUX54323.1 Isopropylmalate/homocitrate/citramalate synthases [Chromobacterium vaccinii]
MLPAADTLNFFRNEFQDCPEFSRPNILDVTLRDGGFTNNFSFSRKEIISHYNLLSGIGVDIVELGYLGGVPELHGSVSGISANIPPDLILECSKLGGAQSGLMIHPSSQVSPALISEAIDAGVDIFRVVYHPSWEKKFTDICEFLMGENRKFFINLALITHYKLEQIVLIANKARLLGAAGFILPTLVVHWTRCLLRNYFP